MKRNLSIIVLTVAVLIAVIYLAFNIHQTSKNELLFQVQDHQLLLARDIAHQIEMFLDSRSRGIQGISTLPSLQHHDIKQMEVEIQRYFAFLRKVRTKAISVYDENGTIIYSTSASAIGLNYAQCGFFIWAKKGENKGKVFVSSPIQAKTLQTANSTPQSEILDLKSEIKPPYLRFLLATPLYQETPDSRYPSTTRKFAGVVTVSIDLEKLITEYLSDSNLKTDLHHVWIMDKDGTLLFQSEHPEMMGRNINKKDASCNQCHLSFDYVKKILQEKKGTFDYKLKNFPKKIAAFAPMEFKNASWIIVINAPYDRVTAFVDRSLNKTLMLLGIVVFALAGSSALIYRNYHLKIMAEEEAKQWQEKRALEEKLINILDVMEDGVYIVNKEYDIEYVNPTLKKGFRLIQGRKCYEYFNDRKDACPWCPKPEVFDGKTVHWEWTSSKNQKTYDIIAAPLKNPDGSISKLEILRDITGLKQTENTLRETQNYLENLIDYANAPIIVWDPEFRITRFNHAFERLTGYTAQEVIGKELSILFPEASRDEALTKIRLTLKGEFWESVEMPILCKGRDIKIALWNSANIYADDGKTLVATIAQGVDITERKQLESQLLQSQKMEAIGQLAGGVAHDFNNLLTAILGYSELLEINLRGKEHTLLNHVKEIKKAVERAALLTHQLLAFSRKQPLQPKILDLNDLVIGTEKMLRRLIGEDIEMVTIFGKDLKCVKADPGQMEQVIMNLVVNARDAMPKGGKLTIKTENVTIDKNYCKVTSYAKPGKFVCLSTEDMGIGMDKKTIQRIFEPFFTTKESGKGTGLGLSTVYGIVKQHEGWINVYSEPGKGSVFKVYLPEVTLTEEKEKEETILLQEFHGKGERVLLVEDDEGIRKYVMNVLMENGYVVIETTSAEEALNIFEREDGNFHLVLSDVVLPGKSGLQLVDELLLRKPELRVILSSGYMDQKSQWPIIRERGFPFIQKPYTLANLLSAVRDALKSS